MPYGVPPCTTPWKGSNDHNRHIFQVILSLITRFMGPIWGPYGADRTQVGPRWAPWTLPSGIASICHKRETESHRHVEMYQTFSTVYLLFLVHNLVRYDYIFNPRYMNLRFFFRGYPVYICVKRCNDINLQSAQSTFLPNRPMSRMSEMDIVGNSFHRNYLRV